MMPSSFELMRSRLDSTSSRSIAPITERIEDRTGRAVASGKYHLRMTVVRQGQPEKVFRATLTRMRR